MSLVNSRNRSGRTAAGTAGTAVTLIGSANPDRDYITVQANGTAVYLGFGTAVTTTDGITVPANGSVSLKYVGPLYVVAAANNTTYRYHELIR